MGSSMHADASKYRRLCTSSSCKTCGRLAGMECKIATKKTPLQRKFAVDSLLQSYFKQLARSGMPSLSTSLACSVFYSEPLKTIALKREYPLSALARSYASEWAGVSPQQLEAWETADGPTSRWFLSKLAGVRCRLSSLRRNGHNSHKPFTAIGQYLLDAFTKPTPSAAQAPGAGLGMEAADRRCALSS